MVAVKAAEEDPIGAELDISTVYRTVVMLEKRMFAKVSTFSSVSIEFFNHE